MTCKWRVLAACTAAWAVSNPAEGRCPSLRHPTAMPGEGELQEPELPCEGLPIIYAAAGRPTWGTPGDDCIIGTSGRDYIDGGAGNDRIFGLGGDDVLLGGRGDDLILGGRGDDEIDGERGDDYLVGGKGDDDIAGGSGDDSLEGNEGFDLLSAERGDDLADGGPGRDTVLGGPGADILRGGAGDDFEIDGGPGPDALFGDAGDDYMSGGEGDDYLDGREGHDSLRGDAGKDEMVGGPGWDTLDGGPGRDLCNESKGATHGCEATSYARGSIVVANRAGRSLSVIDVRTDAVVRTVPMPDDGEPMYLSYSPQSSWLFVADRQNSRAVVFDARDLSLVTTVPLGAGVFHCWIDRTEGQLWVTNDIDDTVSVIDTRKLQVTETVPMPADLTAEGYLPHDVNLDRLGDGAYVSLIGGAQGGVVLRYSSKTFEEQARRILGGDPHLSLRREVPDGLYVNSQESGLVRLVDRISLADRVPPLSVDSAHGTAMNTEYESRFVYTTNIASGGVGGLVTIDSRTHTIAGVTDTPFAVPHNIVLDPSAAKLYVSHSGGGADQVSIYTVDADTGLPTPAGSVTVGLNPFGLTHVPFEFADEEHPHFRRRPRR